MNTRTTTSVVGFGRRILIFGYEDQLPSVSHKVAVDEDLPERVRFEAHYLTASCADQRAGRAAQPE
jgi:hypothetical protein